MRSIPRGQDTGPGRQKAASRVPAPVARTKSQTSKGPDPEARERVQKILANAGVASRRAAEGLISAGRVTRNGQTVSLGDRAIAGLDVIEVDGIAITTGVELRYFLLNKPVGVLTASKDRRGRKTVLDFLDEATKARFRLFPVGRLDMDSSGLILLTNDGFLANRLMHPSFEVPREYMVEVEPVPGPADLAKLRKGVELEDGFTGPSKVALVGKSDGRGLVRMTLHTGKKRQIRRSFQHLGYRVISLNRVRIGSVRLGSLKPGEVRVLEEPEVRRLYMQTGLSERPGRSGGKA